MQFWPLSSVWLRWGLLFWYQSVVLAQSLIPTLLFPLWFLGERGRQHPAAQHSIQYSGVGWSLPRSCWYVVWPVAWYTNVLTLPEPGGHRGLPSLLCHMP